MKKEVKKVNGWKIFGVIVIVLVILLAAGVVWALNFLGVLNIGEGTFTPVNLTPTSLPGYLAKQSLVKGLPGDSKINLFVGNYSYMIEGSKVSEGSLEVADLAIYLPESYIETIGQVGLCSAIKGAVDKKDLALGAGNMESESLAWKYKSILKYRKCFS